MTSRVSKTKQGFSGTTNMIVPQFELKQHGFETDIVLSAVANGAVEAALCGTLRAAQTSLYRGAHIAKEAQALESSKRAHDISRKAMQFAENAVTNGPNKY